MILLHNDGGRSSLSMSRDHRLRVCHQSVFSLTVLISKSTMEVVWHSTL